ncbi:Trm112 family protein [Gemmatimonadota bacterium]
MTLTPELLAILACPQCRGELHYRREAEALDCTACHLRFRIEDDIPVMLIDEAEPIADNTGSP